MKINSFSRQTGEELDVPVEDGHESRETTPQPRTGTTFPADEVVWGVAIRDGFDELDDPFYHRGVTQHAYLEGNDSVALCSFRPPRSGPRTRRRARLGLPNANDNPMCGSCARMVVAPRPRTPAPSTLGRPAVAVPVNGVRPRTAVPVRPDPTALPPVGTAAVPAGMPGPKPSERPRPVPGPQPSPRRDVSPGPGRASNGAGPSNVMETPFEARRRNDGLLHRGVELPADRD